MFKKTASWIYLSSPYIVTIIITLLYTLLALLRHRMFQTYGYDLGIYDQTVWLYSRFIYPFVTIEYKFSLLNHFSPSLALFSPLYWIWSDSRALLIAQSIMVGLSAIAINKIAIKISLPTYFRTILITAYLLFFGYQYAINYDVHSLVYGTALIPWFILALENRKYRTAAVLMAIIWGMKESFPIMIGSIGVVYFLRGRRKLGSIIILSSLVYLGTILKVIMPLLELYTSEYYRFTSSTPSNPLEMITRIFDTDQKREIWIRSLTSYAFIPLFSPITFLTTLTDLAFYFILGNNHPETLNIEKHYRSSLAPLLAWAAIYGAKNLSQPNSRKIFSKLPSVPYKTQSVGLLIAVIYFQCFYNLPLNSLFTARWYQSPPFIADNEAILRKVPLAAGITAQHSLVPHLSQRKEIHILWAYNQNNGYLTFPACQTQKEITPINSGTCNGKVLQSPCGEDTCYWLRFHHKTQYIITDTHQGQNAVTLLMENESKVEEGLRNMEKAGVIQKVEQQGKTVLWSINR